MEDGQEWMAIKPNEIETMRQPIARAAGQVVAFGLGMGYYAFMVSEKPEVKTLTIVERDENVIALFREHILPQFPKKEKIDIVWQDAFEFATNCMSDGYYDHAFVDLWHDVSDGYPLYKQMKALEKIVRIPFFLIGSRILCFLICVGNYFTGCRICFQRLHLPESQSSSAGIYLRAVCRLSSQSVFTEAGRDRAFIIDIE